VISPSIKALLDLFLIFFNFFHLVECGHVHYLVECGDFEFGGHHAGEESLTVKNVVLPPNIIPDITSQHAFYSSVTFAFNEPCSIPTCFLGSYMIPNHGKRSFARVFLYFNKLGQNLGKSCKVISMTGFKQTKKGIRSNSWPREFLSASGLGYPGIAPPFPPRITNRIVHMANQSPRS